MKYLITYDLNKPGQDYPKLFDMIKSFGTWCHALQNTWFISSSYDSEQMRDALIEVVDSSDKIFVTKLSDWSSYNMIPESNWLNAQ